MGNQVVLQASWIVVALFHMAMKIRIATISKNRATISERKANQRFDQRTEKHSPP